MYHDTVQSWAESRECEPLSYFLPTVTMGSRIMQCCIYLRITLCQYWHGTYFDTCTYTINTPNKVYKSCMIHFAGLPSTGLCPLVGYGRSWMTTNWHYNSGFVLIIITHQLVSHHCCWVDRTKHNMILKSIYSSRILSRRGQPLLLLRRRDPRIVRGPALKAARLVSCRGAKRASSSGSSMESDQNLSSEAKFAATAFSPTVVVFDRKNITWRLGKNFGKCIPPVWWTNFILLMEQVQYSWTFNALQFQLGTIGYELVARSSRIFLVATVRMEIQQYHRSCTVQKPLVFVGLTCTTRQETSQISLKAAISRNSSDSMGNFICEQQIGFRTTVSRE